MPEFDVSVLTFRSGIHTARVEAHDPSAARSQVQAECDRGECHCPPESCTDDVDSTLLDVKQVALDNVVILPTVTGQGAGSLVRPVLIQTDQTKGNGVCARPIDARLPTVVTKSTMALVEPLLSAVKTGEVDPRRFVLIDGQPYVLDIRFRMLKNRELARAMGFDDAESQYEFTSTATEITRQIGNAVPIGDVAVHPLSNHGSQGVEAEDWAKSLEHRGSSVTR